MKIILICVCIAVTATTVNCVMTEAQIKSAVKLMRNVCVPKTKISPAQLDAIKTGAFTDEKEVVSYMECILRTGQIMKDGKLNYDALMAQLANLPPNIGDGAKISAEHCKDAVKSSDKYTAAYEFYKCFYEDNPSNFFLP